MRVSSDPKSPDYWRKNFAVSPDIYLDGQMIENVVNADDEAGTVETVKMNGAYPITAGGRFITVSHTGTVEIRVANGSSLAN